MSDEQFARMIREAEKYLGRAYVWGGASPETGFGCSGFVSWVINNSGNGWDVGRQTAEGLRGSCAAVFPSEAKPGDLVFFQGTYNTSGASHVGIYAGNLAAMLAMMAVILSSGTMTAYAYVDETEQTAPEPVITEETPEETEVTPFSVAGNGQLLDDITDDDTKQFLTVQTKNGNTFFMVIDRSRNSENVYMLSLVDERDLAEFIEEEEPEPAEEKPAVIVEEPKPEPVQEEIQPEPEKGGMGMGAVFTILLLGAGCVGGYYYFKIWKPKREEEDAESEDLEFYDGGAYVNEDQENGQGEEEGGE